MKIGIIGAGRIAQAGDFTGKVGIDTTNHAESPEGEQIPILTVFLRDGNPATDGPLSSCSHRETTARSPAASTPSG